MPQGVSSFRAVPSEGCASLYPYTLSTMKSLILMNLNLYFIMLDVGDNTYECVDYERVKRHR